MVDKNKNSSEHENLSTYMCLGLAIGTATLNVNGDLGRASGNGILIGNKIKEAVELEQILWFELITTNLSGKENTYQLPLVLNKVA